MIDFSEDMQKICDLPLKERHSYFQLQYFLVGKEPTIQSRLWRCVRELKARKETLISMEMEIEEINDDLEILDIEIEEIKKSEKAISAIQVRKLQRRKKSKELKLIEIKEKQKVVEEECVFLIKAFKKLEEKEKLKPYDDMESQKEYWNEKLAQDFNLRQKLGLPPDIELMKTILALNSDAIIKQDLLNLINTNNEEHSILLEKTKELDDSIPATNKEKDVV